MKARVVSAPSVERFLKQDAGYRASVLPQGVPCVAVEAAIRWGWDALIGTEGGFVGNDRFWRLGPG